MTSVFKPQKFKQHVKSEQWAAVGTLNLPADTKDALLTEAQKAGVTNLNLAQQMITHCLKALGHSDLPQVTPKERQR